MRGKTRIAGWGLLLLAATLVGSGCIRGKGKSRPDGDDRGPVPMGVQVDVPDAAPEELAAAEDPNSEQAAMAAACALELRHLDRNKPKGEVTAKLVEYAETYPTSAAGIELFRLYGKQLESNQDRAGAIRCYEKGLALYREAPGVDRLAEPLRGLQRQQARETAGREEQEEAYQAKAAQVKQQLGNCPDGYFVVYAEENVKLPRHGGMYFYCYEYEVLCGANAAVSYVLGLPEKYSWKLIQRFPQTPVGRENAYELWKKLLKEKRYGKEK